MQQPEHCADEHKWRCVPQQLRGEGCMHAVLLAGLGYVQGHAMRQQVVDKPWIGRHDNLEAEDMAHVSTGIILDSRKQQLALGWLAGRRVANQLELQ